MNKPSSLRSVTVDKRKNEKPVVVASEQHECQTSTTITISISATATAATTSTITSSPATPSSATVAASTDSISAAATANEEIPKRVDFKRKVKIRRIPRLQDYSERQKRAMYFSREEYKEIRHKLAEKVDELDGNDVPPPFSNEFTTYASSTGHDDDDDDDEEFSWRGLEHESVEGKEVRRQNKNVARRKVLEEQQYQRRRNSHDVDVLSSLYRMHTRDAVRSAIYLAYFDANEAQRIYEEESW